jgi:hypothetical protein
MPNFVTSDNPTVKQGTSPWSDNLTQVGGSNITLGQKTESASVPVTIASDQSAVSTINNITQVGGSSISLGQKTEANSFPVAIASDQSTIPVTTGGFSGTVLTTAVTVTTTAAALPASSLANRKTFQVQNLSNQIVYIGGSGVTTANGIQVAAGDTESIDLGSATIYGIVAASTANVIVMEIS